MDDEGDLFLAQVPVLALLHPVRKRREEEHNDNTDSNGEYSFNNKQPSPRSTAGGCKGQIYVDTI